MVGVGPEVRLELLPHLAVAQKSRRHASGARCGSPRASRSREVISFTTRSPTGSHTHAAR